MAGFFRPHLSVASWHGMSHSRLKAANPATMSHGAEDACLSSVSEGVAWDFVLLHETVLNVRALLHRDDRAWPGHSRRLGCRKGRKVHEIFYGDIVHLRKR